MTVLDGAGASTVDDVPPKTAPSRTSPAITRRSLIVGAICVAAVCGLTPLNDLIFSDTSLVSGFLPLAAVLVAFVLVVGVNAPLSRWWPRRALSGGELAIAMLMTLVACSIPN